MRMERRSAWDLWQEAHRSERTEILRQRTVPL